MNVLSTPTSLFGNIRDYPFCPHYCEVAPGLNMHYVDEGKGKTILLLHGEPSWSYLYRKMIPILVEAGFRTIAPDLIGFGKSDKPIEPSAYSFEKHVTWLKALISHLKLTDINLFCQDWGGLAGLRLAAENEHLFATITASNTFVPRTGMKANEAFLKWRHFSQTTPHFHAGGVLQMGTVSRLSDEVIAAYDAPFPDDSYKAGARIFPKLVPFDGDDFDNQLPACDAAWKVLERWEKPFLTLFGDSDPIMHGAETYFQAKVPGAQGQPHRIIKGAGHFIQEDKGEELASTLADFIGS
ncbi:haloalkane dehalogenase [Flavobacteriaceae bacterium TP-CH-4]|uniref:Haloalkane dehalogenase n=1 Tax=Pelagihabitans pacificus TaxID=2696054 RepID=A0A967AQ01_9FLAO|nr:haloalkane dehalogenase [Pelagihabitans pacificus]NHF58089.1 haloalkane dehalogenase [Pelagihabitans pacificus]